MNQKKSWVLRPLAWICTIFMVLALQFVAGLIFRIGEYLISYLGGLPTAVVVILVLLLGGTFCGFVLHSAFMLPCLLVAMSDKIYPSHHAFRYYFLGIHQIIGCAFLIYAAAVGVVRASSMFWFYARFVYLIFASIVMMTAGWSAANERNDVTKKTVQ